MISSLIPEDSIDTRPAPLYLTTDELPFHESEEIARQIPRYAGMYLSTYHPLNPYRDNETIIEGDSKLYISDNLDSLQSLKARLNPKISQLQIEIITTLEKTLSENIESPELIGQGRQLTKVHEETHRLQETRYSYGRIENDIANTILNMHPNEIDQYVRVYNELSRNIIMYMELQSFISELHAINTNSKKYNTQLYTSLMMLSTVQLLEKYNIQSQSQQIKQNTLDVHDAAKLILLTNDIEIIDKIKAGQLGKQKVMQLVTFGLLEMLTDTEAFITSRTQEKLLLETDEKLAIEMKKFNKLKEKLDTRQPIDSA